MPWFLSEPTIDWASPRFSNSELSVISTSRRSAGKPVLDQQLDDALREPRVLELRGRDVDAERQLLIPGARFLEGLAHDRQRQIADQAAFLGHADELVGRDDAALRMLPAGEHLEAVQRTRREVDLLLEEGDELGLGDAAAKAGFDRVAVLKLAFHRRVEPDRAAAAELLGRVHGDVGAAEQRIDAGAVLVRTGDAERGGDVGVDAGEIERLAEPVDDVMRRRVDHDRGVGIEQEGGGEFVPAEARGNGVLRQCLADHVGGGAEQIVAGEVAMDVVDRLEAVEIDDQHRNGAAALVGQSELLVDGFDQ
jgi:hypothetical protein